MSEIMDEADPKRPIRAMVERFYELSLAGPVLAPVLRQAIQDWDSHLVLVTDFWAGHILGLPGYSGSMFASHRQLPLEPCHFDAWMTAFTQAVEEKLTPLQAELALRKARMVSHSLMTGMFPYRDADGKPTRKPPF